MVEDILARLVAFPSVVGTPNTPIVDWIAGYCRSHGAAVRVLPGPEGDRANPVSYTHLTLPTKRIV